MVSQYHHQERNWKSNEDFLYPTEHITNNLIEIYLNYMYDGIDSTLIKAIYMEVSILFNKYIYDGRISIDGMIII